MAMKVTPPEANVINAVNVIEHILGKDGLIEQHKDILLKPILFNEITLDVLFQYREWFFAFVPTYEYLLTLKNPRNFYAFPAKQQIVFNSTLLNCQKENFLVSHTKNYDKVVLDYGLRPEQLNQKYLESEITLFEDTDKLIMNLKKQDKKDLFVFLYYIHEDTFNSTPDIPNDENCEDDY